MTEEELKFRVSACATSLNRLGWARRTLSEVINRLVGTSADKEVLNLRGNVLRGLTAEIDELDKELAFLQKTCKHRGQKGSTFCNFCGKRLVAFGCGRESCHY